MSVYIIPGPIINVIIKKKSVADFRVLIGSTNPVEAAEEIISKLNTEGKIKFTVLILTIVQQDKMNFTCQLTRFTSNLE